MAVAHRRRITLSVIAALAALFIAFVAYSRWEAGQLRLVRRDLYFPNLPRAFDGLRILHVSDIHTRRFGRIERRLRAILEQTTADLLVATGDFKAHVSTDPEPVLESLEKIFGRLRYPWGKVAVAGNHDDPVFYTALARSGLFDCLVRNSLLLEWRGERLALLGVATQRPTDGGRGAHEIDEATWVGNVVARPAPWALLPDDRATPALVCDRVNAGKIFRVLLAHTPDFIRDARADGIELVLAGDTHGGQIRLPFYPTLLIKRPLVWQHPYGLYREGTTQMYVTSGVGTLYLPLRFLCRPEVALVVLHRGEEPARLPGHHAD